jgi:GMP synthase (glutamine-hydrolysing)
VRSTVTDCASDQGTACVYSQICIPYTISAVTSVSAPQSEGLVFSGGPSSVRSKDSPRPDAQLLGLGIPILGICYGLQVMSVMNGGEVETSETKGVRFRPPCAVRDGDSVLLRGVTEGAKSV